MDEVRMTLAVAAVLRVFIEDVSAPRYGYGLMRETGFASGKLYPILARLERAGWLVKEVEAVDPAAVGRPARSCYRLSADGVRTARLELAAVNEQLRVRTPGSAAGRPIGELA